MSIKISSTTTTTVPVEVIPTDISIRQFTHIKTQSSDREDTDDPFYVMNLQRLLDLYKLWTDTFPSIKPYYAVKCNDDPVMLSILAHLGTGFDCASKGEISRILDMGVSPNDIIFANPCKQTSHIKYAAKKGVSLVTFDNEMELHKLALHHKTSKLVVRICADDVTAKCQLGIKFGCSVDEACNMLHVARYLGLNVVGVSFHVGSGCQSPSAYRNALEMAQQVFQYAEESIGYHFTVLDIGGGFPGSIKDLSLFKEIAVTINSSINDLFLDYTDLTIIAEPGRYFALSCFSLAVQVTSKRAINSTTATTTDDDDNKEKNDSFMYYVNDGVYGSFNCIIYDHAIVEPIVLKDSSQCNTLLPCSIWGPTCDGLDKILDSVLLPKLNIGDWLLFEDMGAYTMSAASSFNGFPKPKLLYCINEEDRQSFEETCIGILTGRLSLALSSSSCLLSCGSVLGENNNDQTANPLVTELRVSC